MFKYISIYHPSNVYLIYNNVIEIQKKILIYNYYKVYINYMNKKLNLNVN